jgi:SAM-dependent methyltransferase
MGRLEDIIKFVEYDHDHRVIIEPEIRHSKIKDNLFDVLKTYSPETVVKAGLGNGQLLSEMAENFDSYFVVVEHSLSIIKAFIEKHRDSGILEKIQFINGDFIDFPVDYYAADLIICIDYFDFTESGRIVDEFRRALQFDAHLFLGSVVLNDDDIDGIYDEFMRSLFPLHNDYYIRDDLKTFLSLNEFDFVKGMDNTFDKNLEDLLSFMGGLYAGSGKGPGAMLEEDQEKYSELYNLREQVISEPYYIGLFTRIKPEHLKKAY